MEVRSLGSPEKKIIILGCGALGSWAAEMATRAGASVIHLVDNTRVKPGVLARQNFILADIGNNKANALSERLRGITNNCTIFAHDREAHAFIFEDVLRLRGCDIV